MEAYPFNISLNEQKELIRRMEMYGTDPRRFECANAASQIISGIGVFRDIEQTNFPRSLAEQLKDLDESLGR